MANKAMKDEAMKGKKGKKAMKGKMKVMIAPKAKKAMKGFYYKKGMKGFAYKKGMKGFYYKTMLGDWIWADTCPCEMCNKVVYEDDEGQMKGKKPTPRAMKAVKVMKRKYRRKLGPKISFKDRTRRKLNAIMADMLSPFFRPD